uniref:BTB domain-containing protein n=1 Tax=Caenorhabditis tropicalis TaxID=1561998 RepID=A0A1I7TCL4_9PELO
MSAGPSRKRSNSNENEGSSKKKKHLSIMNRSKKENDVSLVVQGKKFDVSKEFLAHLSRHSEYFDSLEKEKKEIEVEGAVNPAVFQEFLEVFYGGIPRKEEHLGNVLVLSEKWKCELITKRCVDYMENHMTLKARFELAVEYKLDKIKKDILNGIESVAILKEAIPVDVMEMDRDTMGMVLKRTMELQAPEKREASPAPMDVGTATMMIVPMGGWMPRRRQDS